MPSAGLTVETALLEKLPAQASRAQKRMPHRQTNENRFDLNMHDYIHQRRQAFFNGRCLPYRLEV